jgi:hypothetical protein
MFSLRTTEKVKMTLPKAAAVGSAVALIITTKQHPYFDLNRLPLFPFPQCVLIE